MIETITEPLTPTYIRKLHSLLFVETVADQEVIMFIREYPKTPDKYGIAAPTFGSEWGLLFDNMIKKPKDITLHSDLSC